MLGRLRRLVQGLCGLPGQVVLGLALVPGDLGGDGEGHHQPVAPAPALKAAFVLAVKDNILFIYFLHSKLS